MILDAVDEAVEGTKRLYKSLFVRRKQAYTQVFNHKSPQVEVVLADLKVFCRGRGSKFMGTTEQTLVMVGRNEVWERIVSYLDIPESELSKLTEHTDD